MGFANVQSFAASGPGRAWQGCATDGSRVYLISDRSTQSAPWTYSNNVDVFDMAGNLLDTRTGIYSATIAGEAPNVVDATCYGGSLWLCFTNWHSLGLAGAGETGARVVQMNPSTWQVVNEYNLSPWAGSFESIARHGTSWWACCSGSATVRRYNADFSSSVNYTATPHATVYGDERVAYYQGVEVRGDLVFLSLHGANTDAEAVYAPGVEVFKWTGSALTWKATIVPPTYGSGQGMCAAPDGSSWWFADRPANKIVKCTLEATKTAANIGKCIKKFHSDCSLARVHIPYIKGTIAEGMRLRDLAGDHGLDLAGAESRFATAYGAF